MAVKYFYRGVCQFQGSIDETLISNFIPSQIQTMALLFRQLRTSCEQNAMEI